MDFKVGDIVIYENKLAGKTRFGVVKELKIEKDELWCYFANSPEDALMYYKNGNKYYPTWVYATDVQLINCIESEDIWE